VPPSALRCASNFCPGHVQNRDKTFALPYTRRCGRATAAAAMGQPQVLTVNAFRTSDHRPILLQIKYGDVFASPPHADRRPGRL